MLNDFLRPGDLCSTIQTELAPKIKLQDFKGMYRESGLPPVSPKVLLLVLIMQYLERLTDSAAAHNLRFRLDWKIAFGLELDFKGIHPTTLVHFQVRLIVNDKASYAFDKVLEHLKDIGLVKNGAKQRIDSTHVIGHVRELSRIELFHETLRLFSQDLILLDKFSPFLAEKLEYYADDISTRGISNQQKAKYIREAGLAMKLFIDWVSQPSTNASILEPMVYRNPWPETGINQETTSLARCKDLDQATVNRRIPIGLYGGVGRRGACASPSR